MDGDRDTSVTGRADMGAEAGLLHLMRRGFVKVVQPGLADANHLRVARHCHKISGFRDGLLMGVLRVDADAAPQARMPRHQIEDASRLSEAGADRDHLANAGRASARDDVGKFLRLEVVEVAV